MTISLLLPTHGAHISPCSVRLRKCLGTADQITLSRIEHVLRAPLDTPNLYDVLQGALIALRSYVSTVIEATEPLTEIVARVESLVANAKESREIWDDATRLKDPFRRRLSRHAPYALCMALPDFPGRDFEHSAAGAALALAFAVGKPIANGFASDLRRSLVAETTLDDAHAPTWSRTFAKIRRDAARQFEVPDYISNISGSADAAAESFADSARRQITRKQVHERPRHREGVLDSKCQSFDQGIASGKALRARAERGDESAQLIIIARCVGVSAELVRLMPLLHAETGDWFIVFDAETGVVYTDLSKIFSGAAKPSLNKLGNHREASWIVAKPIPSFSCRLLAPALDRYPHARLLGDLLPNAKVSGSDLTVDGDSSAGLAPSVHRFLLSAAPMAIKLGVDRLCAAQIANDFSVVPSAKQFYGQVDRPAIWAGSVQIFEAHGWDAPVPMLAGLPAGTQVAPTRAAVAEWWTTCAGKVAAVTPPRRYSISSLCRFHNAFQHASASLAVFCLVVRIAKVLPLFADSYDKGATYLGLLDKRTGPVIAPLPIPVTNCLATQWAHQLDHCAELDRRAEKLGDAPTSPLRAYLARIMRREHVPIFFLIDEDGIPIPLSTQDLVHWWPQQLGFEGNFSRHFWQIELREGGVRSSFIDSFVRHHLEGVEPYTSVSHAAFSQFAEEICEAQEKLLAELGISAIRGLRTK